ncbi:MAG: hypothetical protein C5B59_17310 [Bacteroidetes bacterium]|nr:MAG: hypothetical protein C5B59_17310 [Bacteroidota bacterium]
MPALYTITTRASGTILTAAIYNADHQNHVTNGDASHLGGFSQSVSQMQVQINPGDVGSEVLSSSISDELARLRYIIASMRGQNIWYAGQGGSCFGRRDYIHNGSMSLWRRLPNVSSGVTLTSGQVGYGPDRWSVQPTGCTVGIGHAQLYANNIDPRLFDAIMVTRNVQGAGQNQIVVEQTFDFTQILALSGQTVSVRASIVGGLGLTAPNVSMFFAVGTGPTNTRRGFGNFTNEVLLGSASVAPLAGVPVPIGLNGMVVPDGMTQAALIFTWIPTGIPTGDDSVTIGGVQMHDGPTAISVPLDVMGMDYEHQVNCFDRFYWNSFALASNPGQNIGYEGISFPISVSAGQAQIIPVKVRSPAMILQNSRFTGYNPFALNAQARNINTGTDCSSTGVGFFQADNFFYNCIMPAGSIPGHRISLHISIDGGPY